MEFADVVRRRRMVRAFDAAPACRPTCSTACSTLARRAPSAGNTQGLDLRGARGPGADRPLLGRHAAGRAPRGLPVARPARRAGADRPRSPIRRPTSSATPSPTRPRTGLGEGADAWSVPYWYVDTGLRRHGRSCWPRSTTGLGALFFGMFDHEAALRGRARRPRRPSARSAPSRSGYPRPRPSARARPSQRPRRPLDDVVHRGHW